MSKVAIETTSLCKAYSSGGRKIQALKDANIKIGVGDFVTVSGPSGAGKTTLLSIQQKASEYGLRVVDLGSVLDEDAAAVQRLWTTISILPSTSLVSMSIALLNYLASTILGRMSDFKVMKAIGVKWGYAKKIIAIKISLMVIPCCLIGIVAGLFFAINFLVPFQTLPSWNVLLLDLTAFGASTLLMFLGSFYFSTKLLRQIYKA